jgi:hypothetical protein
MAPVVSAITTFTRSTHIIKYTNTIETTTGLNISIRLEAADANYTWSKKTKLQANNQTDAII